ncbi:MAG: heat-inducible transcriptional repressor HrcA [Acidobacteriota bacterium]
MSARQRQVLAAVVVQYVLTGAPVGSRTISKKFQASLSPATIRNTMADLEELGYLLQPHTSAGRVPTDLGYRYYVDSLMARPNLSAREERLIRDTMPLAGEVSEVHELFARAAKLLASLSAQVGLVLVPRFRNAVLKRLEFLNLGRGRVLGIFISQSGMVDHRIIKVYAVLTDVELQQINNLVNENFHGLTLREMRAWVIRMMSQEKALYDRLLSRALRLSQSYLARREGEEKEVLVEGASNVMAETDFADVARMKELFQAFEDKRRLMELLNGCLQDKGPRVLIGSECADPSLSDLALVTSPYLYRRRPVGAIGIIGPRRMEYEHQVALVDSLSRFLTESLAQRLDQERKEQEKEVKVVEKVEKKDENA